jgi:hypothetical protein
VQRDDKFSALFAEMKKQLSADVLAKFEFSVEDEVARRLLWMVALEAPMSTVYRLLRDAGAPSDRGLIRDGMQAVRDRQTR